MNQILLWSTLQNLNLLPYYFVTSSGHQQNTGLREFTAKTVRINGIFFQLWVLARTHDMEVWIKIQCGTFEALHRGGSCSRQQLNLIRLDYFTICVWRGIVSKKCLLAEDRHSIGTLTAWTMFQIKIGRSNNFQTEKTTMENFHHRKYYVNSWWCDWYFE